MWMLQQEAGCQGLVTAALGRVCGNVFTALQPGQCSRLWPLQAGRFGNYRKTLLSKVSGHLASQGLCNNMCKGLDWLDWQVRYCSRSCQQTDWKDAGDRGPIYLTGPAAAFSCPETVRGKDQGERRRTTEEGGFLPLGSDKPRQAVLLLLKCPCFDTWH